MLAGDGDRDAVCDPVDDIESVWVEVTLGVLLPDGVPDKDWLLLVLCDSVSVAVGLCVPLFVSEGVRDTVCEADVDNDVVRVKLELDVPEPDGVADPDWLLVALREGDTVELGVRDTEGVAVGDTDAVAVKLEVAVTVGVELALPVPDAVTEGDRVPDDVSLVL